MDAFNFNGTIYAWESVIVRVDAMALSGALSLDYEEARKRTKVYGSKRDGRALGRTSGSVEIPDASFKVLRATANSILGYLTAKGLGSYGDAEFTLIAQYVEPGQPPITVIATACTIDGEKDTNQEGIDELVTEFTIGTLEIIKNGKRLASVLRSVPL